MSMTLQELCDWHAIRSGWTFKVWDNGEAWRRDCPERGEYEYHPSHPFPPTLDGADASFPNGWKWSRLFGFKMWYAARPTEKGLIPQGWEIETPDTGDKPRDMYELSKLAWEQEAAR